MFYGDSGRVGASLTQWVGFPRGLSTFQAQVVVKRVHPSSMYHVLFIIITFVDNRPRSMRGDRLWGSQFFASTV